METQNQKREQEKTNSIEYYFKNNRFYHLLRSSKKYKDLFYSKEAVVGFSLALVITTLLLTVLSGVSSWSNVQLIFTKNKLDSVNISSVIDLLRVLLITTFAGLLGLLGFIVTGLSILSATTSNKMIEAVNEEGKIKHLVNIMFSYYFTGGLIGITIVSLVVSYISTYLTFEMNKLTLFIWTVIVSYLCFFSIISCVMLLGTSMRFFLLNYWYYRKTTNNNEKI